MVVRRLECLHYSTLYASAVEPLPSSSTILRDSHHYMKSEADQDCNPQKLQQDDEGVCLYWRYGYVSSHLMGSWLGPRATSAAVGVCEC